MSIVIDGKKLKWNNLDFGLLRHGGVHLPYLFNLFISLLYRTVMAVVFYVDFGIMNVSIFCLRHMGEIRYGIYG